MEPYPISRPQLSHFPQIRSGNDGWTNEAAEAGSVWPENDRHIACVVNCPDRVGVVVNVGRMKARFPAIRASPLGFGPKEPHTRPARVVMHLPIRIEECVDVRLSEEVRRAMRTVS